MDLLLHYISLTLLSVPNKYLNDIIMSFEESDIREIFNGNFPTLQMKYNLDFNKAMQSLSDKKLLGNALKEAEEIVKKNKDNKIKAVAINDERYPANLKALQDAPPVLYYKGKGFFKKHEKAIGCVGTRTPTNMGIRAVSSLVEKLTMEGFTIVSGLAEGVDTHSHKTCLENNGITIAVVAHGLDTIYPKENEGLAADILAKNGMLVSEYPVGTKPDKFRFVNRNKIISGLSKSIIVFEAREKSGTMHTVKYAQEQGKKIFCPVPYEDNEQTAGIKKLLLNNEAIKVPTKDDYDVIVSGTGYKIQKDKQKAREVKDKNIYKILKNINIDLDELYKFEMGEDLGKSGITVNKEIYSEFKSLLKENNLTLKDVFNGFLLGVTKGLKR